MACSTRSSCMCAPHCACRLRTSPRLRARARHAAPPCHTLPPRLRVRDGASSCMHGAGARDQGKRAQGGRGGGGGPRRSQLAGACRHPNSRHRRPVRRTLWVRTLSATLCVGPDTIFSTLGEVLPKLSAHVEGKKYIYLHVAANQRYRPRHHADAPAPDFVCRCRIAIHFHLHYPGLRSALRMRHTSKAPGAE